MLFTNCINQINITQIGDAKYQDNGMLIHNIIQYINNYAKTSGSYDSTTKICKNDNMANFESFKFKARHSGRTPAGGNTNDVKIVVILKYLSNIWKTLEMPLISY